MYVFFITNVDGLSTSFIIFKSTDCDDHHINAQSLRL